VRSTSSVLSILLVLAASATTAHAQPAPPAPPPAPAPAPAPDDEPWSRGVTAEQREQAQRLLDEGNELFLASRYPEALAKYQAAVAVWDHPAIRFNIARALIQLDRPVEAYDNIEQALRYGPAPLEEASHYADAKSYERLLRGQIAEIEIRCDQPDVKVVVDGQAFFTCPGSRTTRLLPGNHQVVARRAGYMTMTRDLVVVPGAPSSFDVRLLSIAEATTTTRRWTPWKPWAIAAAGAAGAGLGVLFELDARSNLDEYGQALRDQCMARPCFPSDLPPLAQSALSRAQLDRGIAISAFVAGGAAVVTGLTLVILNRPRTVLPEQLPEPATEVLPQVSSTSIGATLIHRF